MDYAEPFPAALLDRLKRIRTPAVELDRYELVMKATCRTGITISDDWRELFWILGSRAWPCGWMWDLHEARAFA